MGRRRVSEFEKKVRDKLLLAQDDVIVKQRELAQAQSLVDALTAVLDMTERKPHDQTAPKPRPPK